MTSTSLANVRPHPPTADPFADSWYCYVNDPAVGYVKIAFLTYLNEDTADGRQHAHVHVAHAPLDGPRREYDHWYEDVVAEALPGESPTAFRFVVPDAVAIDDSAISLTLPDVEVDARFVGPHHHYFDEPHAASSPFFGRTDSLPDERSHWFVFTLGTPTDYRYRDADAAYEGRALMYVERGWSISQAHGFCYLMAVSEQAKLMLVHGMADDRGGLWAGRLVTPDHDLTFLPFGGDQHVTSDLDSSAARADVTIGTGEHEARVASRAPLGDFYDSGTPSLTVFGAEHPVAKTMNAALEVEVRRDGSVVERISLPQSILEFGGVLYPTELRRTDGPPISPS